MASLKCSNCGCGIHYHSIPSGIEYTFISFGDWSEIESSVTKSDEIESEKYEKCVKAWKCPVCGTFAFSKAENRSHVEKVFKLDNSESNGDKSKGDFETGLFFDDYLWDEITEVSIPVKDILSKYIGYYYVAMGEEAMSIYEDKEMQRLLASYKSIPVAEA